jgi:hypothetical protein
VAGVGVKLMVILLSLSINNQLMIIFDIVKYIKNKTVQISKLYSKFRLAAVTFLELHLRKFFWLMLGIFGLILIVWTVSAWTPLAVEEDVNVFQPGSQRLRRGR